MRHRQVPRSDLVKYYRAAADFWLGAIRIQEDRCVRNGKTSFQERVDMNFYVVAVQRLREVARQVRDRLQIEEARQALDEFDGRWPRLKELRNSEEHVTGPSLDAPPTGIWYFGNSVADLRAGGSVEYIIRIEDAKPSVNKLHEALRRLLTMAE